MSVGVGKIAKRYGKKATATRNALLDAALRVIARKGYSSATIDEIAKTAGVSKGLAYYHFKNKADLASAVLARGLDELIARFAQDAEDASSASEALLSMLDSFSEAVVDNREFGRFFFSELWREGRVWSDEMRAYEEQIIDIIVKQFRRGQDEGTISTRTDATFGAVSSIGLVLSTAMYYFGAYPIGEPISKADFSRRVRDFVQSAVGA